MDNHQCEAIIITCIDYRLQEIVNNWILDHFQPKTFDRVALAGGVKNLDVILSQVDIAVKFHHIQKVILINHEDCGAYGSEVTAEKHAQDLRSARATIQKQYPNLNVEIYYLHLNGTFKPI